MELVELYKSLLAASGCTTNAAGGVTFGDESDGLPINVGGKRLVLPTKEQLAAPPNDSVVIFHPLSENLLRNDSPVFEKYQKLLTTNLNNQFASLILGMLNVAASPATHHMLTPDQVEFLTAVPDIDEKTVNNFIEIIKKVDPKEFNKFFISLYLRRNGKYKGNKYFRVAIITFPFYEAVVGDEDKIAGVKVRKSDKKVYKALLEYIFPQISVPEAYNFATQQADGRPSIAPSMETLMGGFKNVAGSLNDYINLLGDHTEAVAFNSDWVETFNDLNVIHNKIRMVPTLPGNEGIVPTTTSGVTTPVPAAAPAPVAPAAPAPVAPVPTAPFVAPQPAFPMAGTQPGYQAIPPWMPQQPYPGQQMMMPQQPTGIVKTQHGTDFVSLMAMNPALATNAVPRGVPVPSMGMQPGYQMGMAPPMGMVPPMGGYVQQPVMQYPGQPMMGSRL